jgi:hypothetical protein
MDVGDWARSDLLGGAQEVFGAGVDLHWRQEALDAAVR